MQELAGNPSHIEVMLLIPISSSTTFNLASGALIPDGLTRYPNESGVWEGLI